eukprot:scaffold101113_cov18-Tisochrysis_lutea.AAC.1
MHPFCLGLLSPSSCAVDWHTCVQMGHVKTCTSTCYRMCTNGTAVGTGSCSWDSCVEEVWKKSASSTRTWRHTVDHKGSTTVDLKSSEKAHKLQLAIAHYTHLPPNARQEQGTPTGDSDSEDSNAWDVPALNGTWSAFL